MIDDLTALRLQLDWGVDEGLGEAPVDRFAVVRRGRPSPVQSTPTKPTASPDAAVDTLAALHAALDRFTACPLRATATHTVRPSGSPTAPAVLIADAPGRDDDRSGHAFSGADGATVDRVLASVGLSREQVLLTTLVPWRPPGGRPASDGEVQACLPFTRRLLAIVRPRVMLLVGAGPVMALTGQSGTIRQLRGRWVDVEFNESQLKVAALPVLPLAQWLRDAGTKQQLWTDMLQLHTSITTA